MKVLVFLALLMCLAPTTHAQTKCEANINGFKIHNVYIMGNQYNGVAWAYKHISEVSCLTPVTDLSKADAILEVYDVYAVSKPSVNDVSVSCASHNGDSTCTDSSGNMMSVKCSHGVCSSYYGPDPAYAVGQALSSWIKNSWYQAEANIYTTDHKLLWRSVDQKKDHWSDLWEDKVREGTNSPGCEGHNWSVSKDGHKYKNYRRWITEKCGIEMSDLVSIDIKLQAKQDTIATQEQEKNQMVQNAKDAAVEQQNKP